LELLLTSKFSVFAPPGRGIISSELLGFDAATRRIVFTKLLSVSSAARFHPPLTLARFPRFQCARKIGRAVAGLKEQS
jgi:hypothetical protein